MVVDFTGAVRPQESSISPSFTVNEDIIYGQLIPIVFRQIFTSIKSVSSALSLLTPCAAPTEWLPFYPSGYDLCTQTLTYFVSAISLKSHIVQFIPHSAHVPLSPFAFFEFALFQAYNL